MKLSILDGGEISATLLPIARLSHACMCMDTCVKIKAIRHICETR